MDHGIRAAGKHGVQFRRMKRHRFALRGAHVSAGKTGKKSRLLKPADIIILGFAVVVVGAAVCFPLQKENDDGFLFVEVEAAANADGKKTYRAVYPLSADTTFFVNGAEGPIEMAVKDGAVYIVSSPCDNKICESAAPIHRRGEWIACIPGRVVIRIRGDDPNDNDKNDDGTPDSVSY